MFVVWFLCCCKVGGATVCIGIGTVKAGGCGGAMEDVAAAGGIAYGMKIGSHLHYYLHSPLLPPHSQVHATIENFTRAPKPIAKGGYYRAVTLGGRLLFPSFPGTVVVVVQISNVLLIMDVDVTSSTPRAP